MSHCQSCADLQVSLEHAERAIRTKYDALIQVTDERDEAARLNDGLRTRLAEAEAQVAQYQRESADENTCTKHPGAILAYGCSHCYADLKTQLRAAEQRGRATRTELDRWIEMAGDAVEPHTCGQGITETCHACWARERLFIALKNPPVDPPGALSAPPPGP